jgi:hypothetical protein
MVGVLLVIFVGGVEIELCFGGDERSRWRWLMQLIVVSTLSPANTRINNQLGCYLQLFNSSNQTNTTVTG